MTSVLPSINKTPFDLAQATKQALEAPTLPPSLTAHSAHTSPSQRAAPNPSQVPRPAPYPSTQQKHHQRPLQPKTTATATPNPNADEPPTSRQGSQGGLPTFDARWECPRAQSHAPFPLFGIAQIVKRSDNAHAHGVRTQRALGSKY